MAKVETYQVGAEQFNGFGLPWMFGFEKRPVEHGDYVLLMRNAYSGIEVGEVGSWSECLWRLVRFLEVDVETPEVKWDYEIWEVQDDGLLWSSWEFELEYSRMERALAVPADLVVAKGYAEVGRSQIWGDLDRTEGEECAIYVDLESDPYVYYADSVMYGWTRLHFGTDESGWTFYVDLSYEEVVA